MLITGFVILLAAGLSIAGEPGQAQTGTQEHHRHGGDHQYMADHVSARAALEPIGAVEAWGHAMVMDQLTREGDVRRMAAIRVVGLEADSEYTAYVTVGEALDPTEYLLGSLTTDVNGDGVLRLGWPEDTHPPVPPELPPADALVLARAYDASQALALEGEFVIDWFGGLGPSNLIYVERIELEPPDDPMLKGVAKVSRTDDDVQTFETRACRLVADSPYQVIVDGTLVAVVTTDGVGHGELVLSTANGSLPTELQPIEDIRLVDWFDAGGLVVLSGSFTGEGSPGGQGGGVPGGYGNGDPVPGGSGNGDPGQGGDPGGGSGGNNGSGSGGGSGGGGGTGGGSGGGSGNGP
jgi:hypothetical protein